MTSLIHVTPLANSSIPLHVMIPIEEYVKDFVLDMNKLSVFSEHKVYEFSWDDACALECSISITEEFSAN
jgi:hypothetical protein